MKLLDIQTIETIIVIAVYIFSYFITKTLINNVLKNTHLQRGRRKTIVKAIKLFNLFVSLVIISAIWGLKQNEIVLFASTIITLYFFFLLNGLYFLI